MGQKVNPIGFRTGIRLGWQSTWYAPKANYGDFLVEDQKIRDYCEAKYNRSMPKGAVAKVEIIRTSGEVKVTLHSARPGVVIGPRGGEVDKVREEVGIAISEQLGKRASFRRTMKQFCEAAMDAGAKGVKIICSGRLAGSEMARKEMQKLGSIPLHTIDADVDYAMVPARTTYGIIGVKVWIYKGKYGEKIERRVARAPRRGSRGGFGGPGKGGSSRGRGGSRSGAAKPAKSAAPAAAAPAAPVEAPKTEGQ